MTPDPACLLSTAQPTRLRGLAIAVPSRAMPTAPIADRLNK
jgi:hypothetical protein